MDVADALLTSPLRGVVLLADWYVAFLEHSRKAGVLKQLPLGSKSLTSSPDP
jgi:hypothetical protein